MRLEGLRWHTLISTVRLGRDEYRVIRPAKPIEHAPLNEGLPGIQMTVDKSAAVTLAMAWALAARSPHSIVYLPLRHSTVECNDFDNGHPLDLVLLHHSLRFPVSRWKQLRANLGPGRPHTVVCRGLPSADDLQDAFAAQSHRDFKDRLLPTITADTVFLVGSRTAFDLQGHLLRTLVEDGPQQMHHTPDLHCCAEISIDGGPEWLHVEYCQAHRTTTPDSF
ncbi:hypothetical protein [Nocardia sp. NPDC050406]|uniref:hypothetical protein n=1 Tax=Nocardia sp. NPDC050406 TaxID=3364318 RepID=UPI0037931897